MILFLSLRLEFVPIIYELNLRDFLQNKFNLKIPYTY